MAHPISDTYLDQQVARASAVLAAAGAWDAAPTAMACPGFESCTLYISYTRAAAGGDMRFRIEVSPDSTGTVWHRASIYSPGAVASGADTLSNLQRDAVEYGSTAAGLEAAMYGPIDIRGSERLRVACAESGALATPGTVEIEARFA